MNVMRAVERGADALDELMGGQQAGGLDHPALAMDPLGLNGIQPRALDRQVVGHDPHAAAGQFDLPVVAPNPRPDLATDVPGRVVPDQQQCGLAEWLQLRAATGQVLRGQRTDRAASDEAQPAFLVPAAGGLRPADQQPIASQGFGIGIVVRDRLFDQPQGLVHLGPGVQGWVRQARPPGLILKAERPRRVGLRQADQAVACAFFRAYAGSGLVSQCLARFQPTPRRLSARRIVSPLTRSGSSPCSKLTLAARSRVHTLVGRPKVRGLWCSSARRRSARSGVTTVCSVWGRVEPGRSAATPCVLKAWIALRTVWSPQPSARAICSTGSPRALASTIWLRRNVNAWAERKPASTGCRSASESGRT